MNRLQLKLLFSYLVVISVGVGGVVLGIQILAPSLFDRLLISHMGGEDGMMHRGMTESLQRDTTDAFRIAMFQSLGVATVAATTVAVLVSLFVSRRITLPITRMSAASRRIASGEYHARVSVSAPDEIGQLADSLNDMAAQLEDTERRRILLIGDVAHEIRTPLSTLHGYLEGMLDGVIEPTPQLVAQLYGDTGRLQRLIDDLQQLSRVEAGSIPLHPRSVGAGSLIAMSIARLAPMFDQKQVSVVSDVPDQLLEVRADADRVVQVLSNLLSNALRYTPRDGVVTVGARADADVVQFKVRDTGIGISPEHLPHIFDRFYRVDRGRARELGGSGIGLTIARALIETHGGDMWAESAGLGHGSTFGFTLPRA